MVDQGQHALLGLNINHVHVKVLATSDQGGRVRRELDSFDALAMREAASLLLTLDFPFFVLADFVD